MSKRYYWLKLKNSFFMQPKIKKLRSLENGDTLTIIYLKLQLLSIENDGIIFLEDLNENIENELFYMIDENVELIKETISFLEKHKLIEIIDGEELHLPEAKKSIGSESDSAERVRKYREKNKNVTM